MNKSSFPWQVNATDAMDRIHGDEAQASCIAKVLSASQKYMREQSVSQDKKLVTCIILDVIVCYWEFTH